MQRGRSRPIRVAYIQNNPAPYRTPMEIRLAEHKDFEFKVFYCRKAVPHNPWKLPLPPHAQIMPGWHIKLGEEFDLLGNLCILRLLNKGNFDVIVAGGYSQPTMLAALLWARWHHIPYIVFSESNLIKSRSAIKRGLKELLLRPLIRGAAAALAAGSHAKAYLNYYGIPNDRIFIFPNTPDVDRFLAESARYRERKSEIKNELKLDEEQLICFVGRLVQRKGIDILMEAFHRLQSDSEVNADIGLVLVGDGPQRKRLENMVEKQSIRNVHFMGFQQPDNLIRIYSICDLFVLPSYYETWGVVVNEAMACGLPVIVTDRVGAAADIVRDQVNGFIIPVGDVSALCQSMKKVLLNPQLRAQMGQMSMNIIRGWNYEMGIENFVKAIYTAIGLEKK